MTEASQPAHDAFDALTRGGARTGLAVDDAVAAVLRAAASSTPRRDEATLNLEGATEEQRADAVGAIGGARARGGFAVRT